jgi:hypothetical protein
MKYSQYKPDQINWNISKLLFFVFSITAASVSIADIEDQNTTHAWTPDTNIPERPVNNFIDSNHGNKVNIYNGESTDLMLFYVGNAAKFKDNHVGITFCLSW